MDDTSRDSRSRGVGSDLAGAPSCGCSQSSIYPDAATLALATAMLIAAEARDAVKARGRFTLALAGGSTPLSTYRLLAAAPFVDLIPWRDTWVFWGDERCVGPNHPRSNEGMAREAFLDRVPLPRENIHPVRCEGGVKGSDAAVGMGAADEVRRSAARYEDLLRNIFASPSVGAERGAEGVDSARNGPAGFGFDMILLGLGEDGHTASLFPGSEALHVGDRWVVAVSGGTDAAGIKVAGVDAGRAEVAAEREMWRVTLTPEFINRASLAVFLVTGAAKAEVVRQVLEEPADGDRFPACLIHPANGTVRWHLDQEAAALLTAGPVSGGIYT